MTITKVLSVLNFIFIFNASDHPRTHTSYDHVFLGPSVNRGHFYPVFSQNDHKSIISCWRHPCVTPSSIYCPPSWHCRSHRTYSSYRGGKNLVDDWQNPRRTSEWIWCHWNRKRNCLHSHNRDHQQRLHTTLKENTVMMMVAFNVRKYIVKSCGKASLFLLSTLDLVVAKHSKSNIVLRPKVHPYVANTSNCHELKFVLY